MRILAILAASAAVAAPAVALADPVIGGTTFLRVLAPLAGTGVTISPLGNATVGDPSFPELFLPITGGDLTFGGTFGATGTLEHDGSGARLFAPAVSGVGDVTIDFTDIVIDFTTGVVTADLSSAALGLSQADFAFGGLDRSPTLDQLLDFSDPELQLNVGADLVTLLASIGIDTDTDQRIARVGIQPEFQQVPAPAALALFGLGVAALGVARRRA